MAKSNLTVQTTKNVGKTQWLVTPRSNQATHNPANHGMQAQKASFPKKPKHPSLTKGGAVVPSAQPKGTVFGGGVF